MDGAPTHGRRPHLPIAGAPSHGRRPSFPWPAHPPMAAARISPRPVCHPMAAARISPWPAHPPMAAARISPRPVCHPMAAARISPWPACPPWPVTPNLWLVLAKVVRASRPPWPAAPRSLSDRRASRSVSPPRGWAAAAASPWTARPPSGRHAASPWPASLPVAGASPPCGRLISCGSGRRRPVAGRRRLLPVDALPGERHAAMAGAVRRQIEGGRR
jgi:hypothetical protein